MDDTKKDYYDDIAIKYKTAKSAKSSKHKSRKYKNYSRKELESLNGPTYSVNVKKFISYEAFKTLPNSLRKEYLESITQTWNVGVSAIARMWNVDQSTISKLMKRLDVKRSSRPSRIKDTERFLKEFVVEGASSDASSDTSEIATSDIEKSCRMDFCSSSVCFKGTADPNFILDQIMSILPKDSPVKVTINVESL